MTSHGFKIDWDHPTFGGIATPLASARRRGALSFDPILPATFGHLTSVQVTNPAGVAAGGRAVALVYRFPLGTDFPTDGRLVIQEHEDPRLTTEVLKSIAAAAPCSDSLITLGSSQPALLMSGGTGGRVIFIRNGVNFDVTRPEASKAAVVAAATALYAADK